MIHFLLNNWQLLQKPNPWIHNNMSELLQLVRSIVSNYGHSKIVTFSNYHDFCEQKLSYQRFPLFKKCYHGAFSSKYMIMHSQNIWPSMNFQNTCLIFRRECFSCRDKFPLRLTQIFYSTLAMTRRIVLSSGQFVYRESILTRATN